MPAAVSLSEIKSEKGEWRRQRQEKIWFLTDEHAQNRGKKSAVRSKWSCESDCGSDFSSKAHCGRNFIYLHVERKQIGSKKQKGHVLERKRKPRRSLHVVSETDNTRRSWGTSSSSDCPITLRFLRPVALTLFFLFKEKIYTVILIQIFF